MRTAASRTMIALAVVLAGGLFSCASKVDTRQARDVYVPKADGDHLPVELEQDLYVPTGRTAPANPR